MTHRITYAGLTGPGLSHDHNEDAVVVPGACFTGQREFAGSFSGAEWGMAVLDGMGGNNGGETASAEVAQPPAGRAAARGLARHVDTRSGSCAPIHG